ncbi:MAG TPA: response regulator [Candidatus Limnocylindrales bacterium]|nr:response regulator [Candidatus Limnocylindrales bacterium]
MSVTRIQVVDDQFLFAQALGAVIAGIEGFELAGIATTGPQALAMARDRQPDVVLLDYQLPGYGADVLIPRLLSIAPEARIIVLTNDASDAALTISVRAGAAGFMTKDRALEDVVQALTDAVEGQPLLTADQLAHAAATEEQDRRAEEERAHAAALYELSRLVLSGGRPAATLERAVGLIGDLLAADVVAVWDRSSDGRLALMASRSSGATLPSHLSGDADPHLGRALRERHPTHARFGPKEGPAWAGGATEALLASMRAAGGVVGLLVLARRGRPFARADVDLAATLADSLASIRPEPPAPPAGGDDRARRRRGVRERWSALRPASDAPVRGPLLPPARVEAARARLPAALGLALAAMLAAAGALGADGPLAVALAVVLAAASLWAAGGGRLALRVLLLAALLAYVERVSVAVLAPHPADLSVALAGAGALLALVLALLVAAAHRRRA